MKKITSLFLVLFLFVSLSACGEATVPQSTYDELQAQNSDLQSANDTLEQENASLNEQLAQANAHIAELESKATILESKIDDLENGPAALIVSIRNASEAENWEDVVKLAEDLHTRANGSEEDIEGQKLAEAAKKAIEKAEAQRAAEEAKGYETGITYDQLIRNPDDYKGEKVSFRVTVFQSFIDGSNTILMTAVGGNYNNILYVTIPSSNLKSRIIENDRVVIRGISNGIYTYESSGRGMLSVPWVKADIIER